jgi:hypothetical protein
MRRVNDFDPVLRGCLWVKYVQRRVDALAADVMGMSQKEWRGKLAQARIAFLRAYDVGYVTETKSSRASAAT